MKTFLSAWIIFFSLPTQAQDSNSYTLKLNNVTNPEEAKQVTDIIRSIINNQKEPFKYFPYFNNDTDVFTFNSSMPLNIGIFENKFSTIGMQVIEFNKNDKLTPTSHQ